MKGHFPYFPHSSKTTEKKWDDELLSHGSIKDVYHPLAIEIPFYYPYFGILDRENERFAFINREYKPIPKSCRGDKVEYWLKIDLANYRDIPASTEYYNFEGKEYEKFQFYECSNAIDDEREFSEYIQKLNFFEYRLLEVSPIQQRFALTIKRAYELKLENTILLKENKHLKEVLKQYISSVKANIAENNRLSKKLNSHQRQ